MSVRILTAEDLEEFTIGQKNIVFQRVKDYVSQTGSLVAPKSFDTYLRALKHPIYSLNIYEFIVTNWDVVLPLFVEAPTKVFKNSQEFPQGDGFRTKFKEYRVTNDYFPAKQKADRGYFFEKVWEGAFKDIPSEYLKEEIRDNIIKAFETLKP